MFSKGRSLVADFADSDHVLSQMHKLHLDYRAASRSYLH